MSNKFPDNDEFSIFHNLVSGCVLSPKVVDIKFNSHFWPKPNTTEKIEFVSKVQIAADIEFFVYKLRFSLSNHHR